MTQLTIRKLDPLVIEGLKKRAASAGRSMEEEARRILSRAIPEAQLAHQRTALKKLIATRKKIFGDQVFPDSSDEFRKMREDRTRQIEDWVLSDAKQKP